MATKPNDGEPYVCTTGCHTGDFADFDHFCDVTGVTTDETPAAFAVWLSGRSGREIHGRPVPNQ